MNKSDSDPGEGYQEYRCIIDTVPGLIVEVDENLVITLANSETHRRWGSIIEGKTPVYELFSPGIDMPEDGIIDIPIEKPTDIGRPPGDSTQGGIQPSGDLRSEFLEVRLHVT